MKDQGTESEAVLRNILGEFFANPDKEMLEDVLGEGRAGAVLYALKHGEDLFHDPLTGVYDRRLLEDFWHREVARARRYGHTFVMALGDLDELKLINDEKGYRGKHGYQAGDKALQDLACAMLSNSRENVDIVIRYGGDEFLIFLPETDVAGARRFLDRFAKGLPKELKVSFGIAEWKRGESSESFDELFQEANEDLREQQERNGEGVGCE